MHERRRRWWAAIPCCALLIATCARERIIGINERIHHDDFGYLVTRFTVTDTIGSGANLKRAAGRFYLATFVVENRAKRVQHRWDNSIAFVVDDQGRQFENQPELQTLLNAVQPFNYAAQHVTPAGAVEDTQLVFDLPANVARPCLMVRGETLMGDVFDGRAFAKTRVKLF